MDVLATGLSTRKNLPDIKRTILTRDDFGGEGSVLYDEMVQALIDSKKQTEGIREGPGRTNAFETMAKRNMRAVIEKHPEAFDAIWDKTVAPFISGKGDVIFSDVGFRGTMQFWAAAMYEMKNPGKSAFVDLLWTKPGAAENAFRGYIRSVADSLSKNKAQKLFFRHNAEEVPRLLVKSGPNRVFGAVGPDNIEDFTYAMLRHWYAANPAAAAP